MATFSVQRSFKCPTPSYLTKMPGIVRVKHGKHGKTEAAQHIYPFDSLYEEDARFFENFLESPSLHSNTNTPAIFRARSQSVTSIHQEGSSEPCNFIRRPSFEKLERVASESSVSECFWPTLPEWPELDSAAFERGKALLGSMEMDPADFSRDDLCQLALELFQSAGLPEVLSTDLGRVRRFILAVRESMYDNAYHNFYHVFDVTQTVSVIARRTGTLDRLDAWERFALLAAAFCHGAPPPPTPPPTLNRPLLWTHCFNSVPPPLAAFFAHVCVSPLAP